ncbi:hypothetical protein [Flammeovirga agarivorans]|uniref:Glyoxalase-like domain-containing protein n=1 Tax=Flammeovirga agarivorans TaxID=2726742 RepID=A0A7X8SKQ3_9BACT|nr:hypothetical protein [Flammeovirga agarivorans]NLR92023.1 hypothetical protein [Flammeovirga agarivorans]
MANLFLSSTDTSQLNTAAYYIDLGFEIIKEKDRIWAVSKEVQIALSSIPTDRKGILYFNSEAIDLIKKNNVFYNESENGEITVMTPAGILMTIVNQEPPKLISEKTSILGNYMGISIETINMNASVGFWENLGFTIGMGNVDQGWVSMTNNNGDIISLMKYGMCPHQFFNPSMTFFNGKEKNPIVINNIRESNTPIAEEITHFNEEGIVDNIVLKDPSGVGCFVFND